MDQKAIEYLHKLMLSAASITPATGWAVVLPDGVKVHDLESFQDQRRHFRGKFETRALSDFVTYLEPLTPSVKDAIEPPCFVDADTATAVVILNMGTDEKPGHCDHTATLRLRPTAAYAAVTAIAQKGPMAQRDVIEFLEDWPKAIKPLYPEGTEGEPTLSRALAAVRNIDIKSEATTGSEVGNMSETRSGLAKIAATSKHVLPDAFQFTCRPFPELDERDLVLELLVHTSGKEPALKLRLRAAGRHGHHRREVHPVTTAA